MKITLKDGSVKEYAAAMTVIDIAADLSEGLARMACAGEVDGNVVDLRTVVDLSLIHIYGPQNQSYALRDLHAWLQAGEAFSANITKILDIFQQ